MTDKAKSTSQRLPVAKTYKIYVNGKFPRTESGRTYSLAGSNGVPGANMSLCSRKDFRDAVVAARAAVSGWSGSSAYLRGQILYRIAEMLEGRSEQFVLELVRTGLTKRVAAKEVAGSIDRLVYYAGWSDKYQQVFSSVNPVSSSHFNFSMLEPTGVVSVAAPEESALLGLVSVVAPVIAGGNTCVVLSSYSKATCAISFGEVLHASDVPAGVVNLLTGQREELLEHFASHMDVNAVIYCGEDPNEVKALQEHASLNVKRAIIRPESDFRSRSAQGPYLILDTQEVKTTWHPIGV
jgi:acyl-CoA reductase-like NAD-dependent aldehyde dehydrogenase